VLQLHHTVFDLGNNADDDRAMVQLRHQLVRCR
jgi:hypothetical protein